LSGHKQIIILFTNWKLKFDNLTSQEFKKTTQIDANTYASLSTSTTIYTLDSGNTITMKITKDAKTY